MTDKKKTSSSEKKKPGIATNAMRIKALKKDRKQIAGEIKQLQKKLRTLDDKLTDMGIGVIHADEDRQQVFRSKDIYIKSLKDSISTAGEVHPYLSLILLSVDSCNFLLSEYGNDFVEVMMEKISSLIHDSTRGTDIIVRYDSNEFAVILPEAELDDAEIIAGRLKTRVADLTFLVEKELVKITISIGASTYPLDAKTIPELIHNASSALSEAMINGGNIIVGLSSSNGENTIN